MDSGSTPRLWRSIDVGLGLVRRSWFAIQCPPPWLWLADGRLVQRIGPSRPLRLPLECAQQLYWWLSQPWRLIRSPRSLPWGVLWMASWLNSFRPDEVAWWACLGVRSWRELSRQSSDSLAWAIHAQRRQSWPAQCLNALQLLSDKAALLACAPQHWRAPSLLLDSSAADGPAASAMQPSWWQAALQAQGVVLKPQRGHGGRAVVQFRATAKGFEQRALFGHLPDSAPVPASVAPLDPLQLLGLWQRLCRVQEPALAMPYLSHSAELPSADPSVVVRVITGSGSPDAPIAVLLAWLEVPLPCGAVALISLQGRCLPRADAPWTSDQQQALQAWQQLLSRGTPRCILACLDAALHMHRRLPPIDRVAWDWIPMLDRPVLLEGNGGFGLLVPQLFAHLLSLESPVPPSLAMPRHHLQ